MHESEIRGYVITDRFIFCSCGEIRENGFVVNEMYSTPDSNGARILFLEWAMGQHDRRLLFRNSMCTHRAIHTKYTVLIEIEKLFLNE